MGRALFLSLSLVFIAVLSSAQTPTAPATQDNVRSAEEYAALSFQDPIDMDQRTDLGWFTFSPLDSPGTDMTNVSVSGGIFSATSSGNDPIVTIVDTGLPDTSFLGKIGSNFPIDANKYTVFAIRMNLSANHFGQLFWSKNTIFTTNPGGGVTASNAFPVSSGWRFYFVDIPSLGTSVPNQAGNWSGLIDSLRFDPLNLSGVNIEIDWIRLAKNEPALDRTITWAPSGIVDIYLDNDNIPGNGNLGLLAQGVSGTSFAFNTGSLAPDDYYVVVVSSGGTPTASNYSPGFYRVNDIPTLQLTSPSPEGSSDDFATVHLGDPWDMTAGSDLDHNVGNDSLVVTALASGQIENEAGANIGPKTGIRAVSTTVAGSVGDPRVYPLFHSNRGLFNRIDPGKYRVLVLDMGVEGERDLVRGSVARIVWKRTVDALENVSEDIVVRSKAGPLVLDKIIADMATLPIEEPTAGSIVTGWNGFIDSFRVDPHEFPNSVGYFIENVKLAAFERANTSYVIKWSYTDGSAGAPTMQLFYDIDTAVNGNEILITTVNPRTSSQTTWSTSGVPEGLYYIRAVYADGQNTNSLYSRWPVTISHTPEPFMAIDTPTPNELVSVPFTISGWAIDKSAPSGTGIDAVQVWAIPQAGGSDVFLGPASLGLNRPDIAALFGSQFTLSGYTLTVSNALAAGDYTLRVFARSTVSGSFETSRDVPVTVGVVTSNPLMAVERPHPGGTLSGPFRVAGWAIDEATPSGTGVDAVQVWAFPTSGGSPSFLGAAALGGSRPDVGALFGSQFTPSGYKLNVTTPPPDGSYTLVVYARSTVSGTFNNSQSVSVTLLPPTDPRMALETPASGAVVSLPFLVEGWAIERAAASGTGIDAVHVWAFPLAGGSPIFLGTATLGGSRPDVGAIFGSQFTPSGYNLLVSAGLPAGSYRVVVSAHSSITGTFNNLVAIRISVSP